MTPLVVAISGASGATYGVRMLEVLETAGIDSHLVITKHAYETIKDETGLAVESVRKRATVSYSNHDLGAPLASGSFRVRGMAVAPCSIRSLSAIANCADDTLLARAADVQLKEGRPVVLMVRETPLHRGHLRLMTQAAEAGAVIMPPVPAFYSEPHTLADMVDHSVQRCLDRLGVEVDIASRWTGRTESPVG